METIFKLRNEDLDRLTPETAVEFFRQLLCAEAYATNLPLSAITIPSNVYAADGGVDAEVREVPNDDGQGIFCHGLNCYQIKTGKWIVGISCHFV